MNKKSLLTGLTAATAAGLAAATHCAAADNPQAQQRPNICVFLTDDQSWEDTSINGSLDHPTPNMKRLAEAGMTFDRAYVASPSCAPSRAALLTSLYPARSGGMYNHQFPTLAKKTWPDYFHDLGYEVVAIGKVAHYYQVVRYNFDYFADWAYGGNTPESRTAIEWAVKWLKARQADPKKSQKPLCFMVGTTWPHVPWPAKSILDPDKVHLPPEIIDTPETRKAWGQHATAVNYADIEFGKAYDAVLQYLGKDTLMVFSADNGAQFPFHKWNCYNGGVREPFVVSWPGHVAKNVHTQAIISWLDVLPTLLEAAGGKPPPTGSAKGQIDGISFLPVLLGQTDKARDFNYESHSGDGTSAYPTRALVGPRYKYIRNLAPDTQFHSVVDRAPASYWPSWPAKAKTDPRAAEIVARYFKRPAEELYDLEKDPFDMTNLAADPAYATILADYRSKVDQLMLANGDKGLPTEKYFKELFEKDLPNNQVAKKHPDPAAPAGAAAAGKKGKKGGKGKAAQSDDDEG